MEDAQGGGKFHVQAFGCETFRPFEGKDGRRRDQDGDGGWKPGDRATKKMIEWCQDQWRRKDPAYPKENCAFSVNEPCTMPWFDDIAVCFNCGIPFPECRTELGEYIPQEMFTAHALLHFEEIHEKEVSSSSDDDGTREVQGTSRMTLRSSRKE